MGSTALADTGAIGAVHRAIERELSLPGAMTERRFAQFLARQQQLGLVQGERPLCHYLSPFIIGEARYARLCRAAEHVVSALEKLARHALVERTFADAIGLSAKERELAAIDPGYPQLVTVGRLDALVRGDQFYFIEMNSDSPGGIVDQLLVERTLFELPHLRPVRARTDVTTPAPHDAVLKALLRVYHSSGRGGVPTIALVDFESTETRGEIEVLAQSFSRAGYPSFFADPAALRYDGRRLSALGRDIDLVYRRVLVNELVEKYGMDHPLIHAYRDGAACVANSFRTKAVNKKATFAALCDPAHARLFTEAERRAIAEHVPWTRRLVPGPVDFRGARVDLYELVRQERTRFVLKPNDEYGGQGVVLGWTASEQAFSRALADAERTNMIVQERVDAGTARVPALRDGAIVWEDVYFDLCPFVFAGRVEGGIVRLSSTGITNVSAGAGVSALLVVRDGDGR
jgi:hypothetical protein